MHKAHYVLTETFIWQENMLRYLSTIIKIIICSKKWTVFREHSSKKSVSSEEHNIQGQMSEHIFTLNGVFCLLSFLQHGQFWKLGNFTQIFSSFSWGIFSHMAHLDQLRVWIYLMDYNNSCYWVFQQVPGSFVFLATWD